MTTANNLQDKIGDDLKAAGEEGAAVLKEQAEAGIEKTAEQLEGLSEVIDQVASSLSEQDKAGIASYVHGAAGQLASLAQRLQERSMEELTEEAKQLARDKPAVFMLGSVALGFGLTRFLKASGSGHQRSVRADTYDYGRDRYGSAAGMSTDEPMPPGGSAQREAMEETARFSSAGS